MRRPIPVDSVYRLTPVNKTAQCHKCYRNDIESILVEYTKDSNFWFCEICGAIIEKSKAMHKTIEGPLGTLEGLGRATFEADSRSKKRRINVGPASNNDVFDITNYPMTSDGREDSDLRYYSNQGLITSIIDSDTTQED